MFAGIKSQRGDMVWEVVVRDGDQLGGPVVVVVRCHCHAGDGCGIPGARASGVVPVQEDMAFYGMLKLWSPGHIFYGLDCGGALTNARDPKSVPSTKRYQAGRAMSW